MGRKIRRRKMFLSTFKIVSDSFSGKHEWIWGKTFKNYGKGPILVVHTCNLNTQEPETGGFLQGFLHASDQRQRGVTSLPQTGTSGLRLT